MFFQLVCAGCVLRVILFMYWLANSLIFISEISNCVWELSLPTPIPNKSTQLNLCLSARKQTDVFVTLQLSNSDMQTHFKYSPDWFTNITQHLQRCSLEILGQWQIALVNIWPVPYVTDDVFMGVDKRSFDWWGSPMQKIWRSIEMGTKLNFFKWKNIDLLCL